MTAGEELELLTGLRMQSIKHLAVLSFSVDAYIKVKGREPLLDSILAIRERTYYNIKEVDELIRGLSEC